MRRHLVGDEVRVVLHDVAEGRHVILSNREWKVVRALDGTRDAEGVRAAAVLDGVRVSVEDIEGLVQTFAELGFFETETATSASAREAPSFPRDVPIVPLPDYRFSCDGGGACCSLFDTVLFSPLEAAAARVARPDVLDAGHDEARAFTPERGLDATVLAVAKEEGACAYLADGGACAIYAVRPHGCQTYPLRFVNIGVSIRVAPRPECACAFQNGGQQPLTEASRGHELARETYVETLPERVRLGDASISAEDAIAWGDALGLPSTDVARWCEERADELGAAPTDWSAWRARADELSRENAWRAPSDRVRRMLEWTELALARDEERVDDPAEAFFVRASIFVGAHAADGDVGATLREWAAKIRLSRRFPEESRRERWARHPIGLVEALARAHGLRGGSRSR